MLELTTKRPTMQVKVDGEVCEIPLRFTSAELVAMADSETQMTAMSEFFGAYVPGFDQMGDDAVMAIMDEWTRLRKELGEPDMGE